MNTPTRMMKEMSIPDAPMKQPLDILRTPERTKPRATSPPPIKREKRERDDHVIDKSKCRRL